MRVQQLSRGTISLLIGASTLVFRPSFIQFSKLSLRFAAAASIISQKMASLSKNGVPLDCDFDAKNFLLKYPRGAYTTARTVNRHSVFEFETHVARTASSSAEIFNHLANTNSGTNVEAITTIDLLRERMASGLGAVIQDFYQKYPDQGEQELKLTVLATMEKVNQDQNDGNGPPQVGSSNLSPVVYCHACLLPPVPPRPIKVEIRGQPRENALTKDSQWVRDRQSLQDLLSPEANEMILQNEEGQLYEGSQTNFYAIINGTVYTAGEGILEGTVRRLMLEVCEKHNIPVVFSPPNIKEIDTWEAALISSTSRLVLAIDQIDIPQHNKKVDAHDKKILFENNQGSVASNIVDLVRKEVEAHSTKIFIPKESSSQHQCNIL